METLTKEFRNKVYKLMLSELLTSIILNKDLPYKCDGLCYYLYYALLKLGGSKYSMPYNKLNMFNIETYDELIRYKPDSCKCFWFNCNDQGAAKRVEILKQAISETE